MDLAGISKRTVFGCENAGKVEFTPAADHALPPKKTEPYAWSATSEQVDAYIDSLEREFSRGCVRPRVRARADKTSRTENSVSIVCTLFVWLTIVTTCSACLFFIFETVFG